MMMTSLAMPPLMPYSFVRPHGLVLQVQQQIIGGQPVFSGTAFSNSHPLSYEYWPGSYCLDEGAQYTYVSAQEIINNQVEAEDGADDKQQVDDQQEVLELPDLNLDLSL
uniref:Uncharacterized protein n=2 Tax=Chenopodium quinoa TaxID=63459 RepID=A0A803KS99_CHEQI